jgi:hypothetical protein
MYLAKADSLEISWVVKRMRMDWLSRLLSAKMITNAAIVDICMFYNPYPILPPLTGEGADLYSRSRSKADGGNARSAKNAIQLKCKLLFRLQYKILRKMK